MPLRPTAADPALRDTFLGLLEALARAHGLDPEDLEQRVWLRAAAGPLASQPGARLRALTLQEFHRTLDEEAEYAASLRAAGHRAAAGDGADGSAADPQLLALAAERAREVRAAVARLPSRCPALLTAMLESPPLSYRELAEELSMPRGSIGPTRSRCLDCLRRRLTAQAARRAQPVRVSPRRPALPGGS